jgi:hypothetical protein
MSIQEQLGFASHWDEHPKYPLEDWKYEVVNEDTRLGYWEWVNSKIEAIEWEPCGCCGWNHPKGFDGDCRDDDNRRP